MSDQRTERIWRCSCGGSHFLSVKHTPASGGWPEELYVFVEEFPEAGHWARLKACWSLLLHRRHTWIEILLTPAQAEAIARELARHAGLTEEAGDADERERVAEYEALVAGGLSDAEARGTAWPEADVAD